MDPVQGNLAIQLHSGSVLYGFSLRDSDLDNVAYHAACAFHECKFVCETAFKQDTDTVVARDIGCCS